MAFTPTTEQKGKGKAAEPHRPRMCVALALPSTPSSSNILLNRPFITSLAALEASGSRGPPKAAADSILRRLDTLKAPHKPFPRDEASKALVKSGVVELLDGVPERLSPGEEEVVDQVATRFQLDDVEALMAIRALDRGKLEKLSEEDWADIIANVTEERMAVLGTVALLLRARELLPMKAEEGS